MSWLPENRVDAELRCVYCNSRGQFAHFGSLTYDGEEFHLHKCPTCDSLIYDPTALGSRCGVPIAEQEHRVGTKYYFENGYSADFVVRCALSTIPDVGLAELKTYNFVDIGSGNGLGSYLAREVFSMDVFPFEPSITGEASRRLFDLPVERKYFEELDDATLDRLTSKPCLVHLNSVIEHLHDPRALLENLREKLNIEVLAAVIPDGSEIDQARPFLTMLPFLAPGDHIHLPTPDGMDKLFADLGFPHRIMVRQKELFVAIGSRRPFTPPTDQTVFVTTQLLLDRLMQHPDRSVSEGATARQLLGALVAGNRTRFDHLKFKLLPGFDPKDILMALKNRDWDKAPFYTGSVAFCLAVDAFVSGNTDRALSYLEVTEAYAGEIAARYPQYAMEPQIFKWEAHMLKAEILRQTGQLAEARQVLRGVIASGMDRMSGAGDATIERAKAQLNAFEDQQRAAA